MDSLCGKGSALKVCEVIPGSCDGCLDHVGVVAPRLDEISSVPVKRRLVSPVLTLSGEEAMAL
ncbi:hypothetical protein F2Q70_00021895 [Brassica cretica]|uniref:Uncharacterized protein n=1 Tax=Brassica cretica TaxID=69181 RepID=A0A8S9GVR2_BRACR|nr:hypothetical protein F2Q70_00021895 [Brassica cretica]KAF2559004.1 hypothetical protein F2Q68_00015654 [Brassica cretica]